METLKLYHGSHVPIRKIKPEGLFGGIFASTDIGVAQGHGKLIYEMSPKISDILTQHRLIQYYFDGDERLWEAVPALEHEIVQSAVLYDKGVFDLDRSDEKLLLEIFGYQFDKRGNNSEALSDISWECQRLRGVIALRLGYKVIHMLDEYGRTYLVLPGIDVKKLG